MSLWNGITEGGVAGRTCGVVEAASGIAGARGSGASGEVAEIAGALGHRRDVAGTNQAFNALVPLLRPEKEDFIFLDRTDDGVAVVFAAELVHGTGGASRLQL